MDPAHHLSEEFRGPEARGAGVSATSPKTITAGQIAAIWPDDACDYHQGDITNKAAARQNQRPLICVNEVYLGPWYYLR